MKGVEYAYYFCKNKGCLLYCKYFLLSLADLWSASGHILKQRFQALIFTDNIYYENEVFETTLTALIFKYLRAKNRLQS